MNKPKREEVLARLATLPPLKSSKLVGKMNKCNNCPHEPHEGACPVTGDGMLARYHLKPGEDPCTCFTAKPAPQEERRKIERGYYVCSNCAAAGATGPHCHHTRPSGPDWSYE